MLTHRTIPYNSILSESYDATNGSEGGLTQTEPSLPRFVEIQLTQSCFAEDKDKAGLWKRCSISYRKGRRRTFASKSIANTFRKFTVAGYSTIKFSQSTSQRYCTEACWIFRQKKSRIDSYVLSPTGSTMRMFVVGSEDPNMSEEVTQIASSLVTRPGFSFCVRLAIHSSLPAWLRG